MVQFQRDHLETLLAAVDEGTFDRAARRLRITPSAVSQRVRAMEEQVGRVLLRRTVPIRPTDDGAVLVRHARQVRLLDAETTRALGGPAGGAADLPGGPVPVPEIPLAVNADSLGTWFLDALEAARREREAVFVLHREDQDRTASLLRSGVVMAAVTATREPVQGCSSIPLGVMRYRAVAAPGAAATILQSGMRTRSGSVAERLVAATRVDFDRDDTLQAAFVRSVAGRDPAGPRHLVPTSADFARAVVLGFGWGLLPDEQCDPHLSDGTLVDLVPGRYVDVALWWQRWNLAAPLLETVTDAVVATARARLRQP